MNKYLIPDPELQAWHWLMLIPRLDWQSHTVSQCDNQIIVRMTPRSQSATTNRGLPMVFVSVQHPDISHRVRGTGNNLYQAVVSIDFELRQLGIKMPFIHETEIE